MNDKSADAVAQDMIEAFGPEAESVIEKRIRESALDGRSCGVNFWSEVGAAVQALRRERRSA